MRRVEDVSTQADTNAKLKALCLTDFSQPLHRSELEYMLNKSGWDCSWFWWESPFFHSLCLRIQDEAKVGLTLGALGKVNFKHLPCPRVFNANYYTALILYTCNLLMFSSSLFLSFCTLKKNTEVRLQNTHKKPGIFFPTKNVVWA